jgi:hypothetical protein
VLRRAGQSTPVGAGQDDPGVAVPALVGERTHLHRDIAAADARLENGAHVFRTNIMALRRSGRMLWRGAVEP